MRRKREPLPEIPAAKPEPVMHHFYVAVCLIEDRSDGTKNIVHMRQVSGASGTAEEQGAIAYINRVVDEAFAIHASRRR